LTSASHRYDDASSISILISARQSRAVLAVGSPGQGRPPPALSSAGPQADHL